ncbi:uncharacterized protein LAESUDRAFT_723978 [Laetiporus sulphureus 93-53]|uniref:Uncharacterized protein n=1 Tax=Laetiporus sulphureus 93-53 TaxID=1314785 RepID=A0A165F5W9_9APHY|nr:uncharacterized protein LAESUDRAFT_723978 [Laetiporus sulphureus 93-53]KZT08452.1 hypothetical protein LAESUDRAFT_723978 [Laetiporus sulphureus 93-53]
MSTTMLRAQAARSFATSSRATPFVARAAYSRARTYATNPDPTHPTDSPIPTDKSTLSNALLVWLGASAVGVGAWYYTQQGGDIRAKRKADQDKAVAKAEELAEAGKRAANDVVREGQEGYEQYKASGKEKLSDARASAESSVSGTKTAVENQYDAARTSAASTYNAAVHQVEDAEARAKASLEEAKRKAEEKTQSWGAWLGSWVGWGSKKADETKRESASQVAASAADVQREAQKRA